MPKAKLTAALYVLVVFSSGAIFGAVVHRLYMVKTVLGTDVIPQQRRNPLPEWRKHFVDDMKTKVKIDDQQVSDLQQLLDQMDEQGRQVHAQRHSEDQARQAEFVGKVNSLLREDQRALYQQLRTDREAERKRRQGPQGEPKK